MLLKLDKEVSQNSSFYAHLKLMLHLIVFVHIWCVVTRVRVYCVRTFSDVYSTGHYVNYGQEGEKTKKRNK